MHVACQIGKESAIHALEVLCTQYKLGLQVIDGVKPLLLCLGQPITLVIAAVDAKDAVAGAASKAASGAQRMAGLSPKQGEYISCYACSCLGAWSAMPQLPDWSMMVQSHNEFLHKPTVCRSFLYQIESCIVTILCFCSLQIKTLLCIK